MIDFFKRNNAIELKSSFEIDKMHKAGQVVGSALKLAKTVLKSGMSTYDLDFILAKHIKDNGMKPAFLGYNGFPAVACISINEELVHGIPSKKKIIKDGDIVTVDMGAIFDGYYADAAYTYCVGDCDNKKRKLLDTTNQALYKAIEQVKPNNRLGDVSFAVQKYGEENGFSVVRDYTGHGIGRKLHEPPEILNYGEKGTGIRLQPGMVLAIEPMFNEGSYSVKTLADGWTVVTCDGKLCAHFEHTVAVTEDGCKILTNFSLDD